MGSFPVKCIAVSSYELWTEVRDIVQEAVIKTQEKEMQKGKMVV